MLFLLAALTVLLQVKFVVVLCKGRLSRARVCFGFLGKKPGKKHHHLLLGHMTALVRENSSKVVCKEWHCKSWQLTGSKYICEYHIKTSMYTFVLSDVELSWFWWKELICIFSALNQEPHAAKLIGYYQDNLVGIYVLDGPWSSTIYFLDTLALNMSQDDVPRMPPQSPIHDPSAAPAWQASRSQRCPAFVAMFGRSGESSGRRKVVMLAGFGCLWVSFYVFAIERMAIVYIVKQLIGCWSFESTYTHNSEWLNEDLEIVDLHILLHANYSHI